MAPTDMAWQMLTTRLPRTHRTVLATIGTARAMVLLGLAHRQEQVPTMRTFTSQGLASMLGVSHTTVRNHLAHLAGLHLVVVVPAGGRSKVYRLPLPDELAPDDEGPEAD